MRHRITALVAALALSIAAVMPVSAIVYGQPTGNAYSNVGALVDEFTVEGVPTKFSVCTGTLIDDGDGDATSKLFLTAAHCIFTNDVWVSFQAVVPTDPDTFAVLPSAELIPGTPHPHENFACCGANDTFDIAIVELAWAPAVAPAPVVGPNELGEMSSAELRAAEFTAVGYGVVRETKKQAWQSLGDSLGVRSYATQTALALTKSWLTLSMNQATGDGGTCYGDSGGPHFLPDGSVASITVTGDVFCKATDKTYRLDSPVAQEFIGRFVVED